jgi:hypothetical protein
VKRNEVGEAGNTQIVEIYRLFSSRNVKERGYLEDLCLDGRAILEWTFKEWKGKRRLDLCSLRY